MGCTQVGSTQLLKLVSFSIPPLVSSTRLYWMGGIPPILRIIVDPPKNSFFPFQLRVSVAKLSFKV